VHASSMARFQWSRCGLLMATAHVNGSLLMDVDACAIAMKIIAFGEILTRHLGIRFVDEGGGVHYHYIVAGAWCALPISLRKCWLWTIDCLDTRAASFSTGELGLTPRLSGILPWLSGSGKLCSVLYQVQS